MAALAGVVLGVCAVAAQSVDDGQSRPPQIAIADLAPQLAGQEVSMVFTVAVTYRISGAVPVGQVPSFGIRPVLAPDAKRFSVLVSGELADVMYRLDLVAPSKSARGMMIRATGELRFYPAPENAPEKGASYQLHIRDWRKLRVIGRRDPGEAR